MSCVARSLSIKCIYDGMFWWRALTKSNNEYTVNLAYIGPDGTSDFCPLCEICYMCKKMEENFSAEINLR
jgi:hypothetical protein